MTMRVASAPAWGAANPYTGLLADALQREGIAVSHLPKRWWNHPFGADVVLLHWPNEFFFHRSPRRSLKAWTLLALVAISRRTSGQKLVWLVHNLLPHDRTGRPAMRLRDAFLQALDGLIFLSGDSRRMLLDRYPALGRLPCAVVPHGHYRDCAATPVKAWRAPSDTPRVAFMGEAKRYKAPDRLIEAARGLPAGAVEIAIAGQCSDESFARDLSALARGAANVSLDLRWLSGAELEAHVDRADAVALPYRDILNSGSTLFALSRARPVLAPKLGSLVELQQQVGGEWLYLYEGAFGPETLARFLEWLVRTPRAAAPDLGAHDWDGIGSTVAAFLEALAAR